MNCSYVRNKADVRGYGNFNYAAPVTGTISQVDADAQSEAVKTIMAEARVPFETAVDLYIESRFSEQLVDMSDRMNNCNRFGSHALQEELEI
jgi:hypothetical protein